MRSAIDDLLVLWVIADKHFVQLSLSSCTVGVATEVYILTNGKFQRLLELIRIVFTSRHDSFSVETDYKIRLEEFDA